ncbi:MAG: hypothetical protein EBV03_00960 [Proteobacteria bacterium]|nr:hypothetical protein [Pseudomonadota bacterium]
MTANATRIAGYYELVDHSLGIHPRRGTLMANTQSLAEIGALFSPHAVYERGGCEPMRGSEEIARFFRDERMLCGAHRIDSIREIPGIAPEAEQAMGRYFSAIAPERCSSVLVEGEFGGAHCFTDKSKKRYVESASGVHIPFHDVWVIAGGQVVYRASQLNVGTALADDMRAQHRRSASMSR